MVQAGAGEERLGSLRVRTDDIVSERAKLQKRDYFRNSSSRSVTAVFPVMPEGQQSLRLILG